MVLLFTTYESQALRGEPQYGPDGMQVEREVSGLATRYAKEAARRKELEMELAVLGAQVLGAIIAMTLPGQQSPSLRTKWTRLGAPWHTLLPQSL
jgi:hypothetical protein